MKMLRHCYLLAFFLFVAGLGPLKAQSFAWAKLARATSDSVTAARPVSATDKDGNTYVYVTFRDQLTINELFFIGNPPYSAAVIKYAAAGNVLWAKPLHNITIAQLAADNSSGGVFIAAAQRGGKGTWDGAAVPVTGEAFYAKCSAAGALQWAEALPGIASPTLYTVGGFGVVADDAGSAYILGTMSTTSVIGGTPIDASHTFVLKANGAGTPQWVRVLHGTSGVLSTVYLGPKPGGGCLVSGYLRGSLYLGAGTATPLVTAASLGSGFLSSFDAAGSHQWSNVVGVVSEASHPSFLNSVTINSTAADANGDCYVTGSAYPPFQLGSQTVRTGYFLAKYDPSGALVWVRDALPTPGPGSATGVLLAANTDGVTVVINNGFNPRDLATLRLTSPYNFVHYTPQGVEQWAVADAWQGRSPAGVFSPYFMPAGLGLDARGNLYAAGPVVRASQRNPSAPLPTVQLGAQTTVGLGTIVTRLNAYANTLRGLVYLDQNGNGQREATEGAFPQPLTANLVQAGNTTFSAVGPSGQLQAYASPGSYSLSLARVPANYTVSQPRSVETYTGTLTGSSQVVTGLDFGVAPVPNQPDLRVTFVHGMARAGFPLSYHVSVENVGTTSPSGTVTVTLDSHSDFSSSSPAAKRTGQTLTWTYSNLPPFGQLHFNILASLPTTTAMGTVLLSTATVPLSGDIAPNDNTATAAQTVVAAYDPNAIEVNYQCLTPAQVAAQQPLDYTIHFQNLGTASAFTVVLSDTLDYQKLDPATLELVAQSHKCLWSLTSIGPNTGLLTVRFLDINLPERNVDDLGSQGFVRFRVQPRPSLVLGEVVPNRAGIVFDYNEAISTNTATTAVFLATAAMAHHDAAAWSAYPNPATDAITVSAELATAGPVRLELLDVLGRPVRQQTLAAPAGALRQTLDLRGLPPGFYVLRLTPPTGPATSRHIVRE